MKTTRSWWPLLLLALSPLALADTPINETRPAHAAVQVDVRNVKGTVVVSGWDRPEVQISGTLGNGAKGLDISGDADHLRIQVQGPGEGGWLNWGSDARMAPSDLQLKVPRQAGLKIEVVSAAVTVSDVAGQSLAIDSVSGRLKLASGAQTVKIDSVSGDVLLDGSATQTNIQTVSGRIEARGISGKAKLATVSGQIRIEAAPARTITASTVSGDIEIHNDAIAGSRIDGQSMSGDIRLFVPTTLAGHVTAETFSGSIKSDFDALKAEKGHGPGTHLDARLGASGGADISLESFSGDVLIRKQ